jgi:hypothetical protein
MSDLKASQWSQQVVEILRRIESTCPDEDLFCVGYLIPQVELVEMAKETALATKEQWHDWFEGYVEQCLEADNVAESDVVRIQQLIEEVELN